MAERVGPAESVVQAVATALDGHEWQPGDPTSRHNNHGERGEHPDCAMCWAVSTAMAAVATAAVLRHQVRDLELMAAAMGVVGGDRESYLRLAQRFSAKADLIERGGQTDGCPNCPPGYDCERGNYATIRPSAGETDG